MSHFTVMVIGNNPEEQLAPYHEFECTGTDDQYIQDIDKTEELRKEYESKKETVYVDADGKHYQTYDDMFFREPTPEEQKQIGISGDGFGKGLSWRSRDWKDGKGYRTKVKYMPEGFSEKEIWYKDFNSFKDFVQDYEGYNVVPFGEEPDLAGDNKYNYALEDETGNITKVVRRTNPNYKWDWYQLGGRWSGAIIKLKEGVTGTIGSGSLVSGNMAGVDQVRKGDIDFEGIIREAKKEAIEQYNDLASNCGGSIPHIDILWSSMWIEGSEHFKLTPDEKRAIYGKQEGVQIWKKFVTNPFGPDLDDFQCTVEEYAQKSADRAFTTHAIVKDSIWYEKGSMGWFAMVSNAKEQADWNNEVSKLLEGLPDDTLISIYDCHI